MVSEAEHRAQRCTMKKTFGSAFALIMVALFTVAPTSPATATGGTHLHMAGKVGQKAVGTTIIFGADRLAPVVPATSGAPNGCLTLTTGLGDDYLGVQVAVDPIPVGWGNGLCDPSSSQTHDVPPTGNMAASVALPNLPAGGYLLTWYVWSSFYPLTLQWLFTIGDDGTFTSIGVAPECMNSKWGCPHSGNIVFEKNVW